MTASNSKLDRLLYLNVKINLYLHIRYPEIMLAIYRRMDIYRFVLYAKVRA